MNCPNCGRESRGRFCSSCGTPLSVNVPRPDATQVLSAPPGPPKRPHNGSSGKATAEARVQVTSHFRIHFKAGSFAAQNLPLIVKRLEGAYEVIAGLLALDQPADRAGEAIDVCLSDLVIDQTGQPGGGGQVVPDKMEIRDIYIADSPGGGLERSLLLLLLAHALGKAGEPPRLIVDGLLTNVMQRLGSPPASEPGSTQLAEAKSRGELPSVPDLLYGPTRQARPIYPPVAASFVAYLLHSKGLERFKQFILQLDAQQPDVAARTAFGRSMAQLDKEWNKSIKLGSPGGTARFLKLSFSYLRNYKLKVAEIVLYISLGVAFTIGMAKMQGLLFDRALGRHDLHALAVIMGILGGAFIIVSISQRRQSYLIAYVSGSVLKDMRLKMFALLQRLHPDFFQTTRTGDIMSRMTSDMAAVQSALTGSMAQGFRMVLTLVAAVITIFATDWKLAAVGVAGTPVFFLTSRFFGPRAARSSKEAQRQLANATSTLQENLSAQPVVKAFGLENRMIADYTQALNSVFQASLRLTFLTGMYSLTVSSIATGINLLVLGIGAWLVIQGHLTPGILVTFLGLMSQVIGPVQNLSNILQGFQQATGAMDRIDEMLKTEPAIKDAPNAGPIPRLAQDIRLDHVTFGYTEAQPQLRDVCLTIPAGASIALVGPSGCGKSTTLNLVMRFYDPNEGRVTFDGVDIREATLESVRGQMGVVFQDNVLFNISIRENIRLGKLDATDDEVEAACRAAEIHDLIMSLPDEYDTVVGERGSRLSGGQRQRMAIARAILRNPAILILDEATSALDPRTEAAINETLTRIGEGRTTISVTHRLSSVVNADHIYVLDRGRLVEQGTHDELLELRGLYASLWREQGGALAGEARQDGVEVMQLQNVPLFAQLDPEHLASLARRLHVERFAAGDEIIHQGDVGDKLFIVNRGQVEVVASGPMDQARPLAVLREGDYFGEMALLQDIPRTATVRASTPVQLFSLTKADFNGLLRASPRLRGMVERTVAERVAAAPPPVHSGPAVAQPAGARSQL